MYIDRTVIKKKTPRLHIVIFLLSGFLLTFSAGKIVFTATRVVEDDMSPSLEAGDIAYFNKFSSPAPGDIVLYRDPEQPDRYGIRRIVASAGSTLSISDKSLTVDSLPVDFPMIITDTRVFPDTLSYRDNHPATIIPDNHYFLMGDNVDRSRDSRHFGPIDRKYIVGVLISVF